MRRPAALLALLLLALVPGPASARERPPWNWPVGPEHRVLTPFAPPAQKWLSGHRGVDLAARYGQPVLAPTEGTITFSGRVADRTVVTLTSGERRISFEPVSDPLPRGRRVHRGQQIALRDRRQSHEDCGPCLHWGVREGEDYVNPLLFLGATGPSVLWPVPQKG